MQELRTLSLGVFGTTYKQAFTWSEQMLHERQIISPGSFFQEGKVRALQSILFRTLCWEKYLHNEWVTAWGRTHSWYTQQQVQEVTVWVLQTQAHKSETIFLYWQDTLCTSLHTPSWMSGFWFSALDCFIFWFVLSWPLATLMITEPFILIN